MIGVLYDGHTPSERQPPADGPVLLPFAAAAHFPCPHLSCQSPLAFANETYRILIFFAEFLKKKKKKKKKTLR
eukprot:NODE_10289_length_291_cov_20.793388_g8521_i0.p3 GENE.NODE_10289_length_291_cov_20.793388_g8521_i0~~NODE_10289_length_291_cov_20.793388_g8521_i0.p3  ORF type:complete len:73 (+),score=26.79 NODE_10289_length_291_cov_20.793388_g8521_i0:70-288(+)